MQYYVIDCEFVGTDIPDLIINESYTLTGFFFSRFGVFISSFANYYRTGKIAFFCSAAFKCRL